MENAYHFDDDNDDDVYPFDDDDDDDDDDDVGLVEFYTHIYPVLSSASSAVWVYAKANHRHGTRQCLQSNSNC